MTTTEMARPATKIGTNGSHGSTSASTAENLPIFDDTIRTKFLSLICNATYDDVDTELAASYFIEKCLELCGGSEKLLAQTLQTNFVDGRTPVFWVVCHIKWITSESKPIPPIIRQLLQHCGPAVPSTIDDDVDLACCARDRNDIYQLFRRHRHGVGNDTSPLATVAWVKGEPLKSAVWTFKFPQFIDQMLITGSVGATWITYRSIWGLTFSKTTDDKWIVRVERVRSHPWKDPYEPQSFELNVHKLRLYADAKHGKWDTDTEKRTGKISQLCSKDGLQVDFLRQRTEFCDRTRALAITLSLFDWKEV